MLIMPYLLYECVQLLFTYYNQFSLHISYSLTELIYTFLFTLLNSFTTFEMMFGDNRERLFAVGEQDMGIKNVVTLGSYDIFLDSISDVIC